MTRPSEPGQPHRRPGPGAPGASGGPGGRPYGPPPTPGGHGQPPSRPQPAAQRPVSAQPRGPEASPEAGYGPRHKGLLGTLLDTNFDDLITPRLIKLFYTLALILITLSSLIMLAFGIWIFQYGWLLAVAAFIFTPLGWLLGVILTRIFMEAIIIRFKGVEYLRVMKDSGRRAEM